MAGKPRALSPAQKIALKKVRDQRAQWLIATATIEARVREQVAKELEGEDLAYALVLREAFESGIPKRQIYREGMSTTDAGTLDKWLEKTEHLAAARAGEAGIPLFRYDGTAVHVYYPDFPTTARGEGYPEILRGAMAVDPSAPTGWAVVQDPDGELGWFTWEVQQVPTSNPESLTAKVNEWMKENVR